MAMIALDKVLIATDFRAIARRRDLLTTVRPDWRDAIETARAGGQRPRRRLTLVH